MSVTLTGYTNQRLTILRKKSGPYGEGPRDVLYENLECRFVESGETYWNQATASEGVIGSAQAWIPGHILGVRQGDTVLVEEAAEYKIVKINRTRDIDGAPDHTKLVMA